MGETITTKGCIAILATSIDNFQVSGQSNLSQTPYGLQLLNAEDRMPFFSII